jgi:hypothetical protein
MWDKPAQIQLGVLGFSYQPEPDDVVGPGDDMYVSVASEGQEGLGTVSTCNQYLDINSRIFFLII